ncbi:hypothetical protein PQB73_gp221 [Cronobacter phage LPCS28]|uniref:Uncharacterized protein n=1 Tax=Cronobacter phage LPCS28 TaxID=2924885 RepID=A0AAE9G5A4_9CAUD|nr:hypothetical protein PQB73_gp221 [Cronobacter phage LPCS28]UNY46992.1 hypothetical protein EHEKIMEA_00110 [Cronobacter phage LPCS28]
MKTVIVGKPATSSEQKIKSLCKDAYMSITGRLDVDNKIILKKLLTEYCVYLGKQYIDITSKEIVGLVMMYHPVYDTKEQKLISSEISRRVSGSESHELSGHFTAIMKDGKPVRRNGAYLRKFTPDSDAFIAKNTLDI